MAASLKNIDLKILTKIYGVSGRISYTRLRQFSTTVKESDQGDVDSKNTDSRTEESRVPQVGMSEDGQVLICWHPEPTHPYEHTKPLPRSEKDLTEGESVLKVQLLKSEEQKYRPGGPNVAELSNMFFTTKHRWFPKSARRKAVDKYGPEEEDRDGI